MATQVWMPDIDKTMSGSAWRFEGVLDVDRELCPIHATRAFGKEATRKYTYLELMESLETVTMQPLDADFHKKVQRGDFLIGGDSTGYGHDHEYACIALRGAGIAAVICEGTNVNFRRNSIHHGLPVVVAKDIMTAVKTGKKLELNLVEGWIKNVASGRTIGFKPWPDFILDIMREGGLYPWMRQESPATGAPTSPAS